MIGEGVTAKGKDSKKGEHIKAGYVNTGARAQRRPDETAHEGGYSRRKEFT